MSVRLPVLAALTVALLLTAAGCSTSGTPSAGPSTSTPPASSPSPSVTVTPARPGPTPRVGACHRLSYAAAVAPTDDTRPRSCGKAHTTVTFATGSLDDLGAVADGHLLAVDATRVQRRLAGTCPARLSAYVGGSVEDLRTSMLRAIWFSPSVAATATGADWYRCDVTVLAAADRLVRLPGGTDLAGVLSAAAGREQYGMCGTTDPARRDFSPVVCSAPHTWLAISAVDAGGRDYPGARSLSDAGTKACESPARARSTDPLKVTWSYQPPTHAQWAAGQHYGLCWVPTS